MRGPVVFNHKSGETTALVSSDVIGIFVGKPIEARVVKDNAEQLVLSWEVKVSNKDKQYTRMKYTLNVINGGTKATYFAQPLSYSNTLRSEGKCAKVKK